MFDLFYEIIEVLAPFIVVTHLLFLLALAIICSLVVVLLGYYLLRIAGFVIAWQPKDLVGSPRRDRISDSSAIPGGAALLTSQSGTSSVRLEKGSPEYDRSTHRVGALTGVVCDQRPQRDVKIVVTSTELFSEISEPSGTCAADAIDYFEIRNSRGDGEGLLTLTFVLTNQQRVCFYATRSRFDMVILLDQIVANIGPRRREFLDDAPAQC